MLICSQDCLEKVSSLKGKETILHAFFVNTEDIVDLTIEFKVKKAELAI